MAGTVIPLLEQQQQHPHLTAASTLFVLKCCGRRRLVRLYMLHMCSFNDAAISSYVCKRTSSLVKNMIPSVPSRSTAHNHRNFEVQWYDLSIPNTSIIIDIKKRNDVDDVEETMS